MFRIGEFSRLANVTIDTLRHYDAVGLLRPAYIDPDTGYRYYTATQLLPLTRILALKELGFALEEIARLLDGNVSGDVVRAMLSNQIGAAERDLHAARSRLARLQTRLNQLDLEDTMPQYDVVVKPVEAQMIAAIREVVPRIENMPERCSHMFDQIAQWLVAHKLPIGPSLTIYYNEGFAEENIDAECAFIVSDAAAARAARSGDGITVRELAAEPLVASTIVTEGFYKQVGALLPAYRALAQWIEANDYAIAGPPREVFYGSPHTDDLTAEVQYPVAKK